jgi:hypothetical protein
VYAGRELHSKVVVYNSWECKIPAGSGDENVRWQKISKKEKKDDKNLE